MPNNLWRESSPSTNFTFTSTASACKHEPGSGFSSTPSRLPALKHMYRRQLDQLQANNPNLEIPPVNEEEEEDPEQREPDQTLWENQSTDDDEVVTTDVKLSEDDSVDDSESTNKDGDKDQQKEDQQAPPAEPQAPDEAKQQPPVEQQTPNEKQHQPPLEKQPTEQHLATDQPKATTTLIAINKRVDSTTTFSSPHQSLSFNFSSLLLAVTSPNMTQDSNDINR